MPFPQLPPGAFSQIQLLLTSIAVVDEEPQHQVVRVLLRRSHACGHRPDALSVKANDGGDELARRCRITRVNGGKSPVRPCLCALHATEIRIRQSRERVQRKSETSLCVDEITAECRDD